MTTISTSVRRPTQRQQVYDRLYRGIAAGQPPVGERLPAISDLAVRFGTSHRTVQLALEELEARGYVVMKHGSGTFVQCRHRPLTMSDTIAVCMETRAHVFGELASALVNALNGRHMAPLVVDTDAEQMTAMIARISHTDAACLMIHASPEVWAELSAAALPANKPIISFAYDGKPREADFYRVLTDFDAGGRMVARHLLTKGHRNVLLVGTRSTEPLWRHPVGKTRFPGTSFVEEWEEAGGTWTHMDVLPDEHSTAGYRLEEEPFVERLTSPSAPTAIFGTRDVDAWVAQQTLVKGLPHLQGKVEVVGYYDTPWSRAGNPPFTTVNLDLPAMAQAAMGILDALREGKEPEVKDVVIPPQLVVRL